MQENQTRLQRELQTVKKVNSELVEFSILQCVVNDKTDIQHTCHYRKLRTGRKSSNVTKKKWLMLLKQLKLPPLIKRWQKKRYQTISFV